ncbi:MAG: CCA tRNA nucleotidyltransferase [Pseudomonadota bacterium]
MKRLEANWITAPETVAVMQALGGEAFFVGGCVRNTLLGIPVTDIDLATPLLPDEVTRRAEKAGLKTVPTGIDHGTVTVISESTSFEVTTFRRDIQTDGRRAVVAFSSEISDDAARRDFTMNALYATADGEIMDPLGGLADLNARKVRFILDPVERIREDALRILRFFRFSAWYSEEIEPEGLAACAAHAGDVDGLARERIGSEIIKLLSAPDPSQAVAAMAACGVLMRILPGANPEALAPLVSRDAEAGVAPDALTRLAALAPAEVDLRLPKSSMRRLAAIRQIIDENTPPAIAAQDHGAETAIAGHLVLTSLSSEAWEPIAAEIARGAKAIFPLTAADLMAAGIPEGPDIGTRLAEARDAWIESGFALERDELLRRFS